MVDDGWCGVCQRTTDGNCLHLEDGTNIPNPASEIKRLQKENERLWKVVDAAEALIQAQQKPGERVPVTYYADFGRRIQTLRDALRELRTGGLR